MKRDLRKYAQKTNIRLIFGFIMLLMVVGVGLIYLIYGSSAAATGLLCILGGLTPGVLILGLMAFVDFVIRKVNDE